MINRRRALRKGDEFMNTWRQAGIVVSMVVLVGGGFHSMCLADSEEGSRSSGRMPHGTMPHMGGGYGGGEYGNMERHHGGLSPLSMKDSLGLSDEQVNQLRPIEVDYRKAMIHHAADLRIAMIEFGTLLDAKEPDKGAINGKVDEIVALQKKMMMYRVDVLLKVKGILNAGQYDQFRSTLRNRMEGMGHHMGEEMMREGMGPHGQGSGIHPEPGHGTMGETPRQP